MAPSRYKGLWVGGGLIGGVAHDENFRGIADDLETLASDVAATPDSSDPLELFILDATEQEVTAIGGVAPTSPIMRLSTAVGAVTVTKNPQIAAGTDGQFLILEGTSNSDYVILNSGNGLHLHGAVAILDHDKLTLVYHAADAVWEELTRSFPHSEKTWSLKSRTAGGGGVDYVGGYYNFNTGSATFDPGPETMGDANLAYGAHLFVVLGAVAVDDITIRITGTSILDDGTRTAGDEQDIVIPNGSAAGFYVETSKKWIGQVFIVHQSGTAKNCNWGYSKYWDSNNSDFVIEGFEALFLGGANDATPNISLIHHNIAGWTYNAGAEPTPPAPMADMQTDYDAEFQIATGVPGSWKRANLFRTVTGSNGEGVIIQLDTNAGRVFESGNFMLRIRTR